MRWLWSVARLAWARWRGDDEAYVAELGRVYDREFLARAGHGGR